MTAKINKQSRNVKANDSRPTKFRRLMHGEFLATWRGRKHRISWACLPRADLLGSEAVIVHVPEDKDYRETVLVFVRNCRSRAEAQAIAESMFPRLRLKAYRRERLHAELAAAKAAEVAA